MTSVELILSLSLQHIKCLKESNDDTSAADEIYFVVALAPRFFGPPYFHQPGNKYFFLNNGLSKVFGNFDKGEVHTFPLSTIV
ncbi:MAG: hypothetical protein KF690_09245, partial [Bacteroidetes bacterium]|nr:hypothetical protein [Bacteroidota bacterium]